MKMLDFYESRNLHTREEVFTYLIDSIRESITQWDYFVDWDKVFSEIDSNRDVLEKWNLLLGSKNFDSDFIRLITDYPSLYKTIPLLTVRDGSGKLDLRVMTNPQELSVPNRLFSFSSTKPSELEVLEALEFVKGTGAFQLFSPNGISNFRDYLLGVEAGLNSNARKNRGGKAMELVVENFLESLSAMTKLEFLPQVHPSMVKEYFGINLPPSRAGRIFDFVVKSPTQIALIEVNFYGGGGSKLKATAGEYKQFQQLLRNSEVPVKFVWVTDGPGWVKTQPPLFDAFKEIDYVLNLQMLVDGALKEILEL